MPSVEVTHTAHTPSTLQHAWQRLQQAETWEAIPGVDRVFEARHSPEGLLLGYGFQATAGGVRHRGTAVVAEALPPRFMHLDVEATEVRGWIEALLSQDDRLSITVTVRFETRGFLATLFFPLLQSVVERGLPSSVEDFASRLAADS